MAVIAVTTPFTYMAFRERDLLDRRWVVDEPDRLPTVLRECLRALETDTVT
jgi:hypothetical protein